MPTEPRLDRLREHTAFEVGDGVLEAGVELAACEVAEIAAIRGIARVLADFLSYGRKGSSGQDAGALFARLLFGQYQDMAGADLFLWFGAGYFAIIELARLLFRHARRKAAVIEAVAQNAPAHVAQVCLRVRFAVDPRLLRGFRQQLIFDQVFDQDTPAVLRRDGLELAAELDLRVAHVALGDWPAIDHGHIGILCGRSAEADVTRNQNKLRKQERLYLACLPTLC